MNPLRRWPIKILASALWLGMACTVVHAQTPGSLDATFQSALSADSMVACIGLQGDGKIVVGSSITISEGAAQHFFTRLNPDGSLDGTFAAATGLDGEVTCVNILSNGQILAGGAFNTINGIAENHLVRLNADGSVDAAFHADASIDANVSSLAALGDGSIIVCDGQATRLFPDGSLDPAFVPALDAVDQVYGVVVQGDGKLLFTGVFTPPLGTYMQSNVTRLNADGSADAGFHPPGRLSVGNGFATGQFANGLVVQSDGRIVLGGTDVLIEHGSYEYLERLNADGSSDTTFPGVFGYGGIYSVGLGNEDKILFGGSYGGMTRLFADGNTDPSFQFASALSTPQSIAVQPDGQILVSTQVANGLARLNGGDPALPAERIDVSVKGDGRAVAGGRKGVFIVIRTGDPSVSLIVPCRFKGSATNGTDYVELSKYISFPAGVSKVKVKVKALVESPFVERSVKLVLVPDPDGVYELGHHKAKVKIVQD